MQKILLISIPFFLASCSHTSKNTSVSVSQPTYHAQNEKTKPGTGGNDEVYNIHLCFKKSSEKAQQLCLKEFYPKNKEISVYLALSTIELPLSRSTEIRNFNLEGKDKFIIHIPIKNIGHSLHTNIEEAKIYQEKESITIIIESKDFKEKIIIFNDKDEVLEEYSIIK